MNSIKKTKLVHINTDRKIYNFLVNSIQKTIEMLENIEKDWMESDKRSITSRDTENLNEFFLKDSDLSQSNNKGRNSLSNIPNETVMVIILIRC